MSVESLYVIINAMRVFCFVFWAVFIGILWRRTKRNFKNENQYNV